MPSLGRREGGGFEFVHFELVGKEEAFHVFELVIFDKCIKHYMCVYVCIRMSTKVILISPLSYLVVCLLGLLCPSSRVILFSGLRNAVCMLSFFSSCVYSCVVLMFWVF